jgi:uncharacterized protein YndB with AHSA1/START domain
MNLATDRIERHIILKASPARVWQALTSPEEFSRWFGVDFEGKRFVVGETVTGHVTNPGYEHLTMQIWIERMELPRLFSWRWHPAAIDVNVDYSLEPKTLVEFELTAVEGGTRLTVVESGLDRIPIERRARVLQLNTEGWAEQMVNIGRYVAAG